MMTVAPTRTDEAGAARRSLLSSLVLAILTTVLLVAAPSPANAHASVRQTTPFDGERLTSDAVPGAVTIEFTEDVSVPPGGIRVYDETGARVDTEATVPGTDAPNVAGRALAELDDGAYVATWRAVSADGHPIRGAFAFTVGVGADAPDGLVAGLVGGDGGAIALSQRLLTALTYAAVLFLVGALLTAGTLGPSVADRSRALRRVALWTAIGATALTVPMQVMATTGDGVAALLDVEQLATVLGASVGVAAIVRLVGLFAVLRARGRLRLAAAAVALLSFLADGHTRTVEPAWVLVTADALHLIAAAVWFGGLVVLLRELRARQLADDPVGGAGMLARWSRLAAWSVAGVVIGGVAMSWVTVRTPLALISSTYGQLLQVKLALAVIVIGIGAWNHFRLVPRVQEAVVAVPAGGSGTTGSTAGHTTARGEDDPPVAVRTGLAWLRLRRTVRAEVGLLLAVLLVTGVLQNQRPAAQALGIGGAFQVTEQLTDGLSLDIVVDPNVAGMNSIHLYLLDETDRTVSDVEEVTLELSMLDQDIGPLRRTPVVTGPGHWVLTGRELALPGTWEVTATVRVDRFSEASVTVPVIVGSR